MTAGDQPCPLANAPSDLLACECTDAAHSVRLRRSAKEVLHDLARALARQAAREDYASEQAREREGTSPCASPSMPGSARTSRTPDQ